MLSMTGEETASDLRHHVGLAGRSDPLFSADAAALIHQLEGRRRAERALTPVVAT